MSQTSEPTSGALPPVLILAGGLSHERDVSLRSGRRVAQALRAAGHEVTVSDVTSDLASVVTSLDGVVAFPLLHGGVGEDGALRQVLDLFGVPYVGSSAEASRLAFDKSMATVLVHRAGVPTPKQVALPDDMFREFGAARLMQAIADDFGFPIMVKPARGGSALGATRVDSLAALPTAMANAYAYGSTAIIERFVTGTEVAVTVLVDAEGPRALPAVEIVPLGGVYDYAARYTAGDTRFIVPARLNGDVAQRVSEVAVLAGQTLGLDGIHRIDLIVDADGIPQFLEANSSPGMTETSLVPLALEAAGLDLGQVCSALVVDAATRSGR